MDEAFQVARKYQTISLIGRGGMGAVYDAIHNTTGRRVALKLLREDHLARSRAVERFLREARIVGGLSSPHVAGALDAGTDEDSGIPYLAMEFLEGRDLKSLLARRGRLSCGLALVIALQVCRGLAAAHAAGIVHRDMKPANVRLTAGVDGELVVKVLDFGVAKDVMEETSLTGTGDMLGSFSYMAPEQFAMNGPVDFRSDVWGVGMLLFESITGELPIQRPASFGLLSAISASGPSAGARASFRDRYPDVPAAVADLVARALSANPNDRFGSASEMMAAISSLLPENAQVTYAELEAESDIVLRAEATSAQSYTAASWPRDRRATKRGLALSALVSMVLVVGGIGASKFHHRDPVAASAKDEVKLPSSEPTPASSAIDSRMPLSAPSPVVPLESAPRAPSAPASSARAVRRASVMPSIPPRPTPKSDGRDRM